MPRWRAWDEYTVNFRKQKVMPRLWRLPAVTSRNTPAASHYDGLCSAEWTGKATKRKRLIKENHG
jgi:hypothetical protein